MVALPVGGPGDLSDVRQLLTGPCPTDEESGKKYVETYELTFAIVSGVVGGLCVFLLGMKNMSEGMQAVAGSQLRRMIAQLRTTD